MKAWHGPQIAPTQMLSSPVALLSSLVFAGVVETGVSIRTTLWAPFLLGVGASLIATMRTPKPCRVHTGT